jgi:hypothetical protein
VEAAGTTVEKVVEDHRDEREASRRLHRARAMRRCGLVLLGVVVAAGLLNLLGVRMASAVASGGGYELTVRYPAIARPGLGVQWEVEVERPGGFDGPVELSVDSTYFELFDENGFSPAPESETPSGDAVIWGYERPEGDRLVINFDSRIAPTWSWPREGRVALLERGVAVATVTFRTWSLP